MKIKEIGEGLSSLCSIDCVEYCCKKKHGRCKHNFKNKLLRFLTLSKDDGLGGGSSKVRVKLNRKWVTYEYAGKDVVLRNL